MPSDRKIDLTLTEDGDSFLYICTNHYSGELKEGSDGSFATTKDDGMNHGFGIRNIREAVARMRGTVEITAKDGVFTVLARIPMGREA